MAVLSPAEQRAQQEGRLAAGVTLPSGRVKRWGPDEPSTADVLAGLNFSTSDPGGFKDSNFGLARNADIEWPDLALLLNLELYGAGGRTAWEGRLQERPGRHGDDRTVSPGAVGWSAHLNDRPFQEIYIDRDLTRWADPSVQRRIAFLEAAYKFAANVSVGSPGAGAARQALLMDFSNVETVAAKKMLGLSVYNSGGPTISRLFYRLAVEQGSKGLATWQTFAQLGNDDTFAGVVSGTDHDATNVESSVAGSGASKFAAVLSAYEDAVNGTKMGDLHAWEPVVVGSSGITLRGSGVATYGVYASDVIADIVSRFAPKLRFTTGEGGTITPTGYVIPQLAFRDAVIKPADAILAVNAYHQYSWGVEDDRTFFYRPTSEFRKRWRIRRSKGDQDELLGPQADAAVNGVVVSFTDPAGVQRIVGPPELTTAYATSEGLVDTRATNPVNAAGIGAKWGELQLGFITDVPGAMQVGAMWLAAQLENANSRGSVRVTGVVEDEHGAFYPAWAMRAGDSATVVDGDGVERRIIESTYAADARQCSCQLDSTPHKLEALMERMGIALVGVTG